MTRTLLLATLLLLSPLAAGATDTGDTLHAKGHELLAQGKVAAGRQILRLAAGEGNQEAMVETSQFLIDDLLQARKTGAVSEAQTKAKLGEAWGYLEKSRKGGNGKASQLMAMLYFAGVSSTHMLPKPTYQHLKLAENILEDLYDVGDHSGIPVVEMVKDAIEKREASARPGDDRDTRCMTGAYQEGDFVYCIQWTSGN